MPVRGGHRLRDAIRRGMRARGVEAVKVGYFRDAEPYEDGTPVATVAFRNEFGMGRIPERPFFRQALNVAQDDVNELLERSVNPETLHVDPTLADRLGILVTQAVQKRILDLKEPPNAPSTIERKRSANPLIDTGRMRFSVKWKVGHA